MGHPLLSLKYIVPTVTPMCMAHSLTVFVDPLCVIAFVVFFGLLFLACSAYVAHRQLSGEYPLSLSILSRVCLGVGARPISAIKFSYELSHLSHTLMPLPPQCSYPGVFGLLHRHFMPLHVLNSFVIWDSPWVVTAAICRSLRKHPQDWVILKFWHRILKTVPHEHRTFQDRLL